MKKIFLVFLVAAVLGFSALAQAELVNHGNGLIYDTDLNITWYDAPLVKRTWTASKAWAESLGVTDINGKVITGWRLPRTLGTVQGPTTEGELGYLYFVSLKNVYGKLTNVGDFTHLTPAIGSTTSIYQIWTDLTLASNAGVAWDFHFNGGYQHSDNKGCRFYALAAHDGNVGAPVNVPPSVSPAGGGVYQVNTTVLVGGQIFDADGDRLSYQWLNGNTVIFSGTVQSTNPYSLTPTAVRNLPIGVNTLTLKVSDGVNEVSADIKVEIVDTIAPALIPAIDRTIIWPVNNKMIPVTIFTNASDNSGGPVSLKASVSCNEVQNEKGKSGKDQTWTEPVIADGMITLQLLAARSGNGESRIYTITIEATDAFHNTSVAKVNVVVPHDNSNK